MQQYSDKKEQPLQLQLPGWLCRGAAHQKLHRAADQPD